MNRVDRELSHRGRHSQVGRRTSSDLRIRYERAITRARGFEAAGEKVEAERFYQQADHFHRVLNGQAA